MVTPQVLTNLAQQFHAIVSTRDEQLFAEYHNNLTQDPLFDEVIGGLFQHQVTTSRSLEENALLAAIYTLAANIFAIPDCAKTAITTLNNLATNHRTSDGWYADSSHYSDTNISITDLQSVTDPAQLNALTAYFNLPETGSFYWHKLTRNINLTELSDATGLHRKQTPLAFEGGLQMLQHLIMAPENSGSITMKSNLLFCYSLLLSATYLNQPHHAEIALDLFNHLKQHQQADNLNLWTLVILQRLAYEWQENDAQRLSDIMAKQDDCKHPFLVSGLHDLMSSSDYTHQTSNNTKTNDATATQLPLFEKLLMDCQTVVLIEGPAHLARQWLQLANNHYNPRVWFFARSGQQPINAQLLRKSGEKEIIQNLDELLEIVSTDSVYDD